MFASNLVYNSLYNSNDNSGHLNSDDFTENSINSSFTKSKKNTFSRISSQNSKELRKTPKKTVQIIESFDFPNQPKFHLNQGEAIEMIIYHENTKEYEFTSQACEVNKKI